MADCVSNSYPTLSRLSRQKSTMRKKTIRANKFDSVETRSTFNTTMRDPMWLDYSTAPTILSRPCSLRLLVVRRSPMSS
ncbi:unnamed protein product [Caenorhabditis nigoni]